MNVVSEMLSYPFSVWALVDGMLVSLRAFLLGVSLVLKWHSMIGDGLSHVSFRTLPIALAMGWLPLKVSVPVVMLVAFFLLRVTESSRIKSDAAIALISASALVIGIIVISLITGLTMDVSSYTFGSILAMSREDAVLSVMLSLVALILFAVCYNRIFATTLDGNFAKATGVNVGFYNVVIAVPTAATIILGMRMMGAVLISNLIIFLCPSSMRVFKSFGGVVVSSGILSVLCFLIGMTASYQSSTPAGASVMVVNLLVFMLFMAWQLLSRLRV